MNQWMTLLNKEFLEMARNYKWMWVPISFILLGVMDPLTSFYMPQIIDSVGGLPEGAVIEFPTPTAIEVFIMSMGEYQTLGILIIVLSMMGAVAGERKSGVAQLILVKPVSYFSYITSKWVSAIILVSISLFLGLLASWYYTGVLFEYISFGKFLSAFAMYGLWLAFVATLAVFFSTVFKHPGVAGTVTLTIIFVGNIFSGTFSHLLEWSPTQLLPYASELLISGTLPENTWPAIGFTSVTILAALGAAVTIFKSKELAD